MFYDNLLVACEKRGIKITPLVAECGGAKGSISNWKKGASPNSDIVLKLAVRLNVSTDYLLTGKDKIVNEILEIDQQELIEDYKTLSDIDKARVLERVKTLKEVSKLNNEPKVAEEMLTVNNTLATAFSNDNLEENEDDEEYIYIDFPDLPVSAGTGIYLHGDYTEPLKVRANNLTLRANYALRIAGSSMEPIYHDCDVVLVKTQPVVEIGEVGIFIYDDEAYIKEFHGNVLVSLNSDYKDIYIKDPDSFYCKGLVIGILDEKDILN